MASQKFCYERMVVPTQPNYNQTTDYLLSKILTKRVKKHCNPDNLGERAVIAKADARKKLVLTEQLLKQKRKYAQKQRKILDLQWGKLFEKEHQFRESFIKFHKFVKENVGKRERAFIKANEQRQVKNERERSVTKMRSDNNFLLTAKNTMQKKIGEYRIYEEFLKKVSFKYTEYKNVSDILRRYETLMEAKVTLAKAQEEDLINLENARTDMMKFIDNQQLIFLGLESKLSEDYKKYERAHQNNFQLEKIFNSIRGQTMLRNLQITSIQNACDQLYRQMCRRKKIHPAPVDYEKQFNFIKKTLAEVEYSVKIITNFCDQDLKSSEQAIISSESSNLSDECSF